MVVTWFDGEFEDGSEDMTANVVKALTVKSNVEEDSSDEEISDQELAETYKLIYTMWTELCDVCEKKKKMIDILSQDKGKAQGCAICYEQKKLVQILSQEKKKIQDENVEMREDVSLLETKLESRNKSLRMLNNGPSALDGILEEG